MSAVWSDPVAGGTYAAPLAPWIIVANHLSVAACSAQLSARGLRQGRLLVAVNCPSVRTRIQALRSGADLAFAGNATREELELTFAALSRLGLPLQEFALSDEPARAQARLATPPLPCLPFSFDAEERLLWQGEVRVHLTETEACLLGCLMQAPGRSRSYAELLRAVWQLDFDPGTNRLAYHVSNLNGKLKKLGGSAKVKAVRKRGYALV